jgi:hypothetical protein
MDGGCFNSPWTSLSPLGPPEELLVSLPAKRFQGAETAQFCGVFHFGGVLGTDIHYKIATEAGNEVLRRS